MIFDESEHTIIGVLPANGWKIGHIDDAGEACSPPPDDGLDIPESLRRRTGATR
jgi:hypothetical protein